MLELTQSNIDPGNCWQTGIACLLGVPAEQLPDQVEIEASGESWNNALLAYLFKHHDLTFAKIPSWQFPALRVTGHHLMVGPTVRTKPEKPIKHVVVGFEGQMVWDPHPSRAGLLAVDEWEIIVPIPDERREAYSRMKSKCLCPSCRT